MSTVGFFFFSSGFDANLETPYRHIPSSEAALNQLTNYKQLMATKNRNASVFTELGHRRATREKEKRGEKKQTRRI